MYPFLIFLLCIYLNNVESELDIRIKCPLKWVSFDVGFNLQQIPSIAIRTNMDENFIIKTISNDSNSYIGQLSTAEMDAFAAVPGILGRYRAQAFSAFEILTNPFGCYTQWIDRRHEDVNLYNTNPLICRSEMEKLSGHIYGNLFNPVCAVAIDEESAETTSQYTVLISYRPGVMTKITNFDLAIPPNSEDGELDFIGLDELTNNANVTVIQVVTHTKKVSERISYTETSMSSSATSVSHGFGLFLEDFGYGANINFQKGEGESSGTSETLSNSTERIVEVSREVIVPPFTSLTVCSTISNNDKYNSSYKATAEFSSPGLSAAEVEAHVKSLGVDGPFTRTGDVVSKAITGSIAATLAMETQFIVTPKNSFKGCEALHEELTKAKNARINKKSVSIVRRHKDGFEPNLFSKILHLIRMQ